jgi:hypothetical protein
MFINGKIHYGQNNCLQKLALILRTYFPVYMLNQQLNRRRLQLNAKQLKEINMRLEKLEKQSAQDLMVLLEIMSSATFFGGLKKTNCEYAKEDQCSFFFLKEEAKNKLPIAMDCRIKDCKDIPRHCHLELSNLTCALCPLWRNSQYSDSTLPKAVEDTKTCREE